MGRNIMMGTRRHWLGAKCKRCKNGGLKIKIDSTICVIQFIVFVIHYAPGPHSYSLISVIAAILAVMTWVAVVIMDIINRRNDTKRYVQSMYSYVK